MKKGGRGESKKTKERKIIQIKQSKQISPVKEVILPQEIKNFPRAQKRSDSIPSIKKNEKELTQEEIAKFSTCSDQLICVQLMKNFMKRQEPQLQQFLNVCPEIMTRAFKMAINLVENSYKSIREQRIVRMKEETIIFVASDKDLIQRQKGRTLNNWIKQNMRVNENRLNFVRIIEENLNVIKGVEQQIKRLSIEIREENVRQKLKQIINQINYHNENEIEDKIGKIRNEILQVVFVTNQMRRIHMESYELKMRQQFNKIRQKQELLRLRNNSHTLALFSIEDYFV